MPFTFTDLAGLRLWHAARLETAYSDTNAVPTATDQSGLGNHSTQAVGSAQPTYRTGILNGQPVYRFDGGDCLSGATIALAGDMTLFLVAKSNLAANPEWFVGHGASGETEAANILYGLQAINQADFASFHEYGAGTNAQITLTNYRADNGFHLHTLRRDVTANTLRWRVDGADVCTVAIPNDPTGGGTGVVWIGCTPGGGAGFLSGDIPELVIVDGALTDAEVAEGEALLNGVYNFQPAGALLADGVWTWFNGPEAVYDAAVNRTYVGYLNGFGKVFIASYDHATGAVQKVQLHAYTEVDDHDSPAFLIRPDGRIVAFYSDHANGTSLVMRCRISTNPHDITAWGSSISPTIAGVSTYCLVTQLPDESDRIYWFFRDANWRRAWIQSDDGGATWNAATVLFANGAERPYMHIARNGTGRIDFVVTDGHPDEVAANSIYHFYYTGGNYYKSDGTLIGGAGALPLTPADVTRVYDGTTIKAWNHGIAIDESGNPVIVYAAFHDASTDHRYRYARWTGSAWQDAEVCTAGGPLITPPHYYSGGIEIADASTLYCSRESGGLFTVWRFTSDDDGATWSGIPLGANVPGVRNFRPVVPEGVQDELLAVWPAGTYTAYVTWDTDLMRYALLVPGAGLEAVDVPALPVPATLLNPGDVPPVADALETGDTRADIPVAAKDHAVRLDAAARYGGGCVGICEGFELSEAGGLNVTVAAGSALVDGLVTTAEQVVALTADERNFLWLDQAGEITARIDTAAPATLSCYLGNVLCGSAGVQAFDVSGVTFLRPFPWRQTADAGAPGDTPPARSGFTGTAGGLYLSDGSAYRRWADVAAAVEDVDGGATLGETITAFNDLLAKLRTAGRIAEV